jgi:hypothetical protein
MDARLAGVMLCTCVAAAGNPQEQRDTQPLTTPLTVPAGAPLRLYLTKRLPKKAGAPVEAKLLMPLYAFDREVIPVGTQVLGRVSSVQPVSKWMRTRAILGGDFTPLRNAKVQFTTAVLPGGRQIDLHTLESQALNSMVPLKPPKQRKQAPANQPSGVLGKAEQSAKAQVNAQIDRVRSIPDLVRGPDKKERVADLLMSKLPYHPQYVRSRTRFDAELSQPLDFGSGTLTEASLALLGSQPAAGSVAHARLITPLDSRLSSKGQRVEAALMEPLFATGHMLVLPEGTHLNGVVVQAKRAGWFHRGGRLLFNFQSVDLPAQTAQLKRPAPTDATRSLDATQQVAPPPQQPELQFKTRASLTAAESGSSTIKVDEEGSVRATESKTRFLGTALALLIAQRSGDTDAGRHEAAGAGASSNVGGRTLGGGMGLGLLGTGLGQISPNVGAALGYYGLGWSVFSTVIARGAEVQFGRNAVVDVGFSDRPHSTPTQLKADVAAKLN